MTESYISLLSVGQTMVLDDMKTAKEIGIPIVIALGLFVLFGWFLRSVTNRFFKQMDTVSVQTEKANVERKEITSQFTGLLETTLQNNTAQMAKASSELARTSEILKELQGATTAEHGTILDRLHEVGQQVGELKGASDQRAKKLKAGT